MFLCKISEKAVDSGDWWQNIPTELADDRYSHEPERVSISSTIVKSIHVTLKNSKIKIKMPEEKNCRQKNENKANGTKKQSKDNVLIDLVQSATEQALFLLTGSPALED